MALDRGPRRTEYADRFRCIGPACEDTCCAGWNVSIDQPTYDKYQTLTESPIRHLLAGQVVLNPESKSLHDFARVTLGPGGRCPFHSAERLCLIQVEHGAEALSPTCANFPRTTRRIDGRPETSLQLSCPEAARIVLLDRNFLRLENATIDAPKRYRRFAAMAGNLQPANGNPFQYFWEVRRLTLLLLHDRTYPLWQRLFLLGMFCKKLGGPPAGRRAVPELMKGYGELMAEGKLRGVMEQIPPRTEAQFSLVAAVLLELNRLQSLPARFLECLQDAFSGVGHREGDNPSEATAGYAEAYARYYEPFFRKREYMLENYLLSYVVRRRFPYGDEREELASEGPLTEFTLMALRFALIKGVLIGMAGHYREDFGPDHIVKLVQSFARGVEHTSSVRTEMLRCIQAAALDRSEAIAMMLRN